MSTDWGYNRSNGPSTWYKCFPAAAGEKQSPVDIKPTALKFLNVDDPLQWKYLPENTVDVVNTGYCWKVHVHGEGSELRGGPLEGTYVLEQFHCHWGPSDEQGSEHTVEGKQYAGEIHLVHWNSTKYQTFEEAANHPDGLCVLGIFLKPGMKHEELEKVISHLSEVQFKGQTVNLSVPVDPSLLIPENSKYWTYQGSLTTPPCSECVIWIVFKEPVEVSCEQLITCRFMKSYCVEEQCPYDEHDGFVQANFRPTLPLGRREICEGL